MLIECLLLRQYHVPYTGCVLSYMTAPLIVRKWKYLIYIKYYKYVYLLLFVVFGGVTVSVLHQETVLCFDKCCFRENLMFLYETMYFV